MGALIDLTGQRFGRLIVLSRGCKVKHGDHVKWTCIYDCGGHIAAGSGCLRSGKTRSCGCYRLDQVRVACVTHGKTKTRCHRIWSAMKARCSNPATINFKYYGGRGIRVCKRWLKFENFYADMGEPPTEKHSIDRTNNDGNYTPKNCRWALPKEQSNNRRVLK